jgi:hypothetical protein
MESQIINKENFYENKRPSEDFKYDRFLDEENGRE